MEIEFDSCVLRTGVRSLTSGGRMVVVSRDMGGVVIKQSDIDDAARRFLRISRAAVMEFAGGPERWRA